MNRTVTNGYIAAGAAMFLLFFAGCGTSDYEKHLSDRIKQLESGSKFNILSSPIDVPGTQVSIRIPKKNEENKQASENLSNGGFENPPLQESTSPDGKPIDSRRIKPNLIDLTDLKLTFEGFIEDRDHGKQPYYLYVAVSTGPNRSNFPRNMQSELASKITEATQLSDYKTQTPEGLDVMWQECQATGNQQFYYVKPVTGEGQFVPLKGTIEMFFHDENDTLVILIWRWPDGLEKTIDFKSWMEMVAGCVIVKPKT